MVNIMNKPEQVLKIRLGRRGYSLEDCKELLENRRGDVSLINKRGSLKTSLKDTGSIRHC